EVSTQYDQYYQFEKYSQLQDSHLTRYGQQIETSPSHSPLCSLCTYCHAPQQFEMSTQAPVSLRSSQLFVPTNLSNLSNSSQYDYQMLNYANNQFTNQNMHSLKRFNSSLFIKKSDGTTTNILNDDDSLGVDDNLSSGTQSSISRYFDHGLFSLLQSYRHHMALGFPPADTIVAKTRKYVCNYPKCGKSFSTSGHLARHNKIHTGEKNFSCKMPGCPSKFSRHDNMMQHYRTHLSKSR
ncbi:13790_t:CDS:2, partial [Cetraspora pellucida]